MNKSIGDGVDNGVSESVNGRALAGKTVLLINDNLIQLEIFRRYLESADCIVHAFLDSSEALKYSLKMPQCDAVVTDLYMPNIDGWKVCRLLRSDDFPMFNDRPILVTSATFSGTEAESITRELGANAFVNVPIGKSDFLTVLSEIIDGQRHVKRRQVLIVEDDPVQQKILEKSFEKNGFLVHCAGTGKETRELIAKFPVDIIILDYQLPDTEGDHLLKEIKEFRPHAVVVVITATNRPEKSVEMLKMGAFAYMVKPLNTHYLLELCEIALRQKALLVVEDLLESRTQEALRNERNYKLLLNSIPTGIFELNSKGEIEFVSSQWESLTGFKKDEVLGKKWTSFLKKNSTDEGEQLWQTVVAEKDSLIKKNWQWSLKDGSVGWFDLSFSKKEQEQHDSGHPIYIGVLEDISDKMRIEQIKEREKVRAFQSHKMVSLGQLSTGIAHEINNPLTIALFRSKKVLKDLDALVESPEKLKKSVEKVADSCDRIMKVVSSLRSLAIDEDSDEVKPTNLPEVIQSTAKFYQEKLSESRISLDITCGDSPIEILGKTSDLSQVLVNLFDNAMFFANHDSNENVISVECSEREGQAEILFSDNGKGISDELLEKIFEPFFTTRSAAEASGLGLSIAQSIVERYHGKIELIHSHSPTTFRISIPLLKKKDQAAA